MTRESQTGPVRLIYWKIIPASQTPLQPICDPWMWAQHTGHTGWKLSERQKNVEQHDRHHGLALRKSFSKPEDKTQPVIQLQTWAKETCKGSHSHKGQCGRLPPRSLPACGHLSTLQGQHSTPIFLWYCSSLHPKIGVSPVRSHLYWFGILRKLDPKGPQRSDKLRSHLKEGLSPACLPLYSHCSPHIMKAPEAIFLLKTQSRLGNKDFKF